jgi:hypothetical protein
MKTKHLVHLVAGPAGHIAYPSDWLQRPVKKPLFPVLLGLLTALGLPALVVADSNINAVNRYAWGANVGWLDWRADGANGVVIGAYVCSGYIYAANCGWIHLGDGTAVDGVRYQNNSGTDFGVNHDGLGNLRGFAYGANIGWVNFEAQGAPKVDLVTGKLSGLVYGANIGWISLSNALAFVQTDSITPGVDSDGDGIADGYEYQWAGDLATMNATTDQDGDGVSDREEFLADTNPSDAGDFLRITGIGASALGAGRDLTWTSQPTRQYRIQLRDDLNAGAPWLDSGLGLILPGTGSTTKRSLPNPDPAPPHRFFRVEAVRPLSP